MISSRAKHIRSLTGEVTNLAKGNTNDTAYLVRQGQQEVVEEDGGGRNCVILAVIPQSASQKRVKFMLTSIEVLGV